MVMNTRDMLDAQRLSAPALTELEQRRNGQRRPIRRVAPQSMTRRLGIEDETGRAGRTGNVECQRFLNSPSNSDGAVEVAPFEQFESRFSHASSAL
jgi:hypothetical protein